MNHLTFPLLAFLGLLNTLAVAQTTCQEARSTGRHGHELRSSTASISDSIDLLHHRIELDLTRVDQGEIGGICSLRFAPRVNGVNTLPLDLLDLTVDSVKAGGLPLSYSHLNDRLIIDLGQPFGPGDTLEVLIAYGGDPATDASGFGGFYTGGNIAYNLGVAFTAQPHSFGRAWFPCFDNFVERSTYEFIVTTKGGRTAWCNGDLVAQTFPGGDTVVTHWAIDQTMPSYLASVASANYVVARDTFPTLAGGTVPVDLIALPGDTSELKSSFVHLPDAFACFEQRLGHHRWDRIGYVLTPVGAMEHPTNIAYPSSIVDGGTTYETTMAHELAHHWFGDLVTCERAEEMYINEGFAEYLSYVFVEHVYGREAYMDLVRDNHRDMVHRAHLRDEGWWALAEVPQDWTYGDHSYNKGADVLHTLRSYLGDSLFHAGLTDFLVAFAFQPVGTADLRDHLSQVTGVDLTEFFDDWILQPGWAAFEVDSFSTAPQGGEHLVTVHVEQKLRGADHPYSGVPITFTCTADDGSSWTTPDSLFVGGTLTSVSFTAPFAPVFVALNTDERLALAITADTDTLSGTGLRTYGNANLRLTLNNVPAPTPIRLEQYWVAADPWAADTWAWVVSPDRWWRVQADLPPGTDIEGRVLVDARPTVTGSLDLGLVQGGGGVVFHEDSLVLLHRSDASQPWSAVPGTSVLTIGSPTDGYAFIEFPELMAGDYTLGWRRSAVGMGSPVTGPETLMVHPNPADEMIIIKRGTDTAGQLLLRDMSGRIVRSMPSTSTRTVMDVQGLAAGQYSLEFLGSRSPGGPVSVVIE